MEWTCQQCPVPGPCLPSKLRLDVATNTSRLKFFVIVLLPGKYNLAGEFNWLLPGVSLDTFVKWSVSLDLVCFLDSIQN
ncbi:MAG: hypothetical protein V8S95_12975 [Odoribacter sp.]